MLRTIQIKRFCKDSAALHKTILPQRKWKTDDRTTELKELHKGRSVIYGIKQHDGYKATEKHIFKIGRADDFNARFESYREAQSAVFVMDTPFPRAAEGVVKNILRNCRVWAEETVKLTAERLQAVMVHAVRSVDAVVAAMGHTPPNTTHRAYDSNLCKYMVALLKNETTATIRSPEDTPLHPNDCVGNEKRKFEAEREEERVEDRRLAEVKRVSAKRRREEARNAAGLEEERQEKRKKSVQRFVKECCVVEEYRCRRAGSAGIHANCGALEGVRVLG